MRNLNRNQCNLEVHRKLQHSASFYSSFTSPLWSSVCACFHTQSWNDNQWSLFLIVKKKIQMSEQSLICSDVYPFNIMGSLFLFFLPSVVHCVINHDLRRYWRLSKWCMVYLTCIVIWCQNVPKKQTKKNPILIKLKVNDDDDDHRSSRCCLARRMSAPFNANNVFEKNCLWIWHENMRWL